MYESGLLGFEPFLRIASNQPELNFGETSNPRGISPHQARPRGRAPSPSTNFAADSSLIRRERIWRAEVALPFDPVVLMLPEGHTMAESLYPTAIQGR